MAIARSLTLFVATLMPDLIAAARALYKACNGDVDKARGVLEIVKDHGGRLDAHRARLDAELAQLRAMRSREPDA